MRFEEFKRSIDIDINRFSVREPAKRGRQDRKVLSNIIDYDEYLVDKYVNSLSPKVILDIGGHIGAFGILAKHYWPDALLIAIEPNTESCDLYRQNIKNFNFNNCVVINKAISYRSEATWLSETHRTTGGGALITPEEAKSMGDKRYIAYKNIKLLTVEDLLEEFELKEVGLAKWDCEGGEIEAFACMTPESASKFKAMLGEYHVPSKEGLYSQGTIEDIVRFFKKVKRKFSHLKWNILLPQHLTLPDGWRRETYTVGSFWAMPNG